VSAEALSNVWLTPNEQTATKDDDIEVKPKELDSVSVGRCQICLLLSVHTLIHYNWYCIEKCLQNVASIDIIFSMSNY